MHIDEVKDSTQVSTPTIAAAVAPVSASVPATDLTWVTSIGSYDVSIAARGADAYQGEDGNGNRHYDDDDDGYYSDDAYDGHDLFAAVAMFITDSRFEFHRTQWTDRNPEFFTSSPTGDFIHLASNLFNDRQSIVAEMKRQGHTKWSSRRRLK